MIISRPPPFFRKTYQDQNWMRNDIPTQIKSNNSWTMIIGQRNLFLVGFSPFSKGWAVINSKHVVDFEFHWFPWPFQKKNSYDFFLIRESRMTCFSKVQNLDQKSLQLRCWQLTSIFHKLRHLVLPPPLEFAQINRNSLHNVEGYFCGGFTTVDALLKNGKIFSEISLSGTRHELSCFFFTRIFHQKKRPPKDVA